LRFGIAGVAAAGDEARAIHAHPNCEIVAVADISKPNLETFLARYPVAAYSDVETMCQNPNVDAVFVGTPTHFHRQHAIAAIANGKHVVCAKPMATRLDHAQEIVQAAENKGVRLSVGHSQAFEPPIFWIRQIIESGDLGRLWLINTWNYTDWMYRGRLPAELDPRLGGGVVFRQGAHQLDIVRWIGGGLVSRVRAMTGNWDTDRPAEGIYSAFLEFADGAVASCTFSGYDHFHSAELGYDGEGGRGPRGGITPGAARAALRSAQSSADGESAYKAARRSGAGGREPPTAPDERVTPERERTHSLYGLTVVSCEHGDIRQSGKGLLIYDDNGKREVDIPRTMDGRDVMISQFYDSVLAGRDPPHDGRWGLASLELQLAILESGRTRTAVDLHHQVPVPRIDGMSLSAPLLPQRERRG
jgi:phthalate 4,5-cis-dihydrodiol dehydrogenase